MENYKHYIGVIVLSFLLLGPVWAQEGKIKSENYSIVKQNNTQRIHTLIYEGRTYQRSIEGYITLVEEDETVDDNRQQISTIIYEGRTYKRSKEGYITLVEEHETVADNRQQVHKIIYEGQTYNRSIEGYITLVGENETVEDNRQQISTIIYEGQTYNRSIEGHITLIDTNNSNLSFSNRKIELSKDEAIEMDLYPNPANETLNIHLNSSHNIREEIIALSIWTIAGKKIMQLPNHNPNSKVINLDISDLYPGIYVVKLNSPKGEYNQRLIKQ